MGISSTIAWRYFRRQRQVGFLPLLTATAILGVATGVAVLITVLSIMKGFNSELTRRLIGFNPHITVESHDGAAITPDILGNIEDAESVAPYVEGEAIIQANVGDELMSQAVRVRGIDLESFSKSRKMDFHFPNHVPDFSGIILGSEISQNLLLHPNFSDEAEILAPLAGIGPHGDFILSKGTFKITGLFKSGAYQYDNHFLFLPYKSAKKVLGLHGREGLAVELKDISAIDGTIDALKSRLGNQHIISSWKDKDKKLFAALRLERIAMGIVLGMVILISSFTIMGIILIMVASREKDVALLESMGMKKATLKKIFILQGALIGIIGSTLGVVIANWLCNFIAKWNFKLPSAYYIEFLPVEKTYESFFIFWLIGIMIATVASLWPTFFVGRRSPVAVLRYE